MSTRKVSDKNKYKYGDKTDWNKVLNQTDAQIEEKSSSDKDSPVLKNKRYTKPGKPGNK